MILKALTLGDLATNCYILADEQSKECAVFDPAAEAGRIADAVATFGFKVKYIILTHTHIDHISALDELKDITGGEVALHADEADSLNSDADTMSFIIGTSAPSTRADIRLNHGDTLTLGNTQLKIFHTPGHTVGGISVLCGDILISGDTLFHESIGRTDFRGGDFDTLISSVKEHLFTLDGDTKVYPGHGPATTIDHEICYNPFF